VLNPLNNVKELKHFLGMVQYYRDMWAKCSEMLAPLSDLVGECGETKTARKNKAKKQPWHWNSIHQIAFDNVKTTIAKEVVLAYPDFTKPFDIYRSGAAKKYICCDGPSSKNDDLGVPPICTIPTFNTFPPIGVRISADIASKHDGQDDGNGISANVHAALEIKGHLP